MGTHFLFLSVQIILSLFYTFPAGFICSIRKVSTLSNFSNVRSIENKEGRKEAITPFGGFHALAVISIVHVLKTRLDHVWCKASQTCHNQANIPVRVTLGKNSTQNLLWKFSTGLIISNGGYSIQGSLENKL